MNSIRSIMMLKYASEKPTKPAFPNYDAANAEHRHNKSEVRDSIRQHFSNAGIQEKSDSKLVGKLFSGNGAVKETPSPLLKVAYAVIEETEFFKYASPAYQQVMLRSFDYELEKIAAEHGLSKEALLGAVGSGIAKRIGGFFGGARATAPTGLAARTQAAREVVKNPYARSFTDQEVASNYLKSLAGGAQRAVGTVTGGGGSGVVPAVAIPRRAGISLAR